MKPLLLIISCLSLSACAGYSLRPSVSYEDESGRTVSASITITPVSAKSPRNILSK